MLTIIYYTNNGTSPLYHHKWSQPSKAVVLKHHWINLVCENADLALRLAQQVLHLLLLIVKVPVRYAEVTKHAVLLRFQPDLRVAEYQEVVIVCHRLLPFNYAENLATPKRKQHSKPTVSAIDRYLWFTVSCNQLAINGLDYNHQVLVVINVTVEINLVQCIETV